MKIKHLLMAAAAMVMAVACDQPVEPPTPTPTPTPDPEVVASATITVGEVVEGRMGYDASFSVTTENVTAAAFHYLATEEVTEEVTAEYVLTEGAEFLAEELNTEAQFTIRGLAAGKEYTIFVAYKDAEDKADMTTATVTAEAGDEGGEGGENDGTLPEEITAYEAYVSTGTDDLYDFTETTVKFVSEEYEVIVVLETDNIFELPDEDLGFTFDNGISSAKIQTIDNGGELIAEFVEGNLIAVEMYGGDYSLSGEFTTESGATVYVGYDGPIDGLGGGNADTIEFVVVEGKLSQDPDMYGPTVWVLELKSENNETVTAVIDILAEQNFLGSGYWSVGMMGMSTTPYVMYGPSTYVDLTNLVTYSLYPSGDGMLQMESGYDGTEQGSDVNIISGSLGLYDENNIMEAGTIRFTTPTPIALYGDAGDTEEVEKVYFYINPDAGMFGELVNSMNLNEQMEMPGHQFMFRTSAGDEATMTLFDMTQENYQYISGDMMNGGTLYPIMSEPMGSCLCVANSQYAYFNIGGVALFPVVPETATDANGRPYGANVMTMMPDVDMNMIDFYIPAEDMNGKQYVIEGSYTGALGYTGGGKQTVELRLDLFGFDNFTAVLEGNMAYLTSRSNNGVLTFELSNWGEPFASEEGVLYIPGDNMLSATFTQYDGMEDAEYKVKDGGRMMLYTTEEYGVYEMVFSSRAPLEFEGDNLIYQIGTSVDTYTVTIDGLMKAPAAEGDGITEIMGFPYGGGNVCLYVYYGDNVIQLDYWNDSEEVEGLVAGTYNVTTEKDFDGTKHLIAGTQAAWDGDGTGCYIGTADWDLIDIVNGGSMILVDNGDGTWTMTLDLTCENGETYKGEYTGAIDFQG